MANDPKDYPVQLTIDYPKRDLNRLTTFFRIFTLIPIAIILGLLSGSNMGGGTASSWDWSYASSGIVFLPLILMIPLLFRLATIHPLLFSILKVNATLPMP